MTLPNNIAQWGKLLIGGTVAGGSHAVLAALGINGAASAGLDIKPLDWKEMIGVFASGCIVGAVTYLAKSPVPPDPGNTAMLYRDGAAPAPQGETTVGK